MIRLYLAVLDYDLTYEKALSKARTTGSMGICRIKEDNNTLHYYQDGNYYIVDRNEKVIVNPVEIKDMDKEDWAVVYPSKDVSRLIKKRLRHK